MEQRKCLLKIEDLSVGTDEITINHHISLEIGESEIVGIIGESGCGKSTLLKSILSLNEASVMPLNGDILFRGRSLLGCGNEDLRQICGCQIAMVFQSLSMAFDPLMKIKKQFYEAVKYHNMSATPKGIHAKAVELLSELRFHDPQGTLNAYPFELSGGMVQRAALVMALLNEPKLILADEVTSALDTVSQDQVVETMLHIREKFGTVILFVTHNMNVVSQLADKVAVMYGGRIVEWGTAQEVLKHPGHPYTVALNAAVPKAERCLPTGIAGMPPAFEKAMDYCPFHSRCPHAEDRCLMGFPAKKELSTDHYIYCCKSLNGGAEA